MYMCTMVNRVSLRGPIALPVDRFQRTSCRGGGRSRDEVAAGPEEVEHRKEAVEAAQGSPGAALSPAPPPAWSSIDDVLGGHSSAG